MLRLKGRENEAHHPTPAKSAASSAHRGIERKLQLRRFVLHARTAQCNRWGFIFTTTAPPYHSLTKAKQAAIKTESGRNMFKQQKSAALILSERSEIATLQKKIVEATNTIPLKLRNGGTYQDAVTFKKNAAAARIQATSKAPNLGKLRLAWISISSLISISSYYPEF